MLTLLSYICILGVMLLGLLGLAIVFILVAIILNALKNDDKERFKRQGS